MYQLKKKSYGDDPPSNLVAATSFAVDAGILARDNLHIVGGDGDTGGTIVARQAATNCIKNDQSHYLSSS